MTFLIITCYDAEYFLNDIAEMSKVHKIDLSIRR